MNKKIPQLVAHYKEKYDTNDPFELADHLGILYQFSNIDFEGCYMFLKNHRYIFISNNLSVSETRMVMAHELGHAILHRKQNCYFIKNKTLLLNSKIEKEANIFAAELLIPDEIIIEHCNFSITQLAMLTGYDQKLVELKTSLYSIHKS